MLIRVALPLPVFRLFDYELASSHTSANASNLIGSRVVVPFGNKQLLGIICELPHTSDVPSNKLKQAVQIMDDTPLFDAGMLQLAQWLADYYIYPLGDVLSVMMPKKVREGESISTVVPHWCISKDSVNHVFSKQAKKQHAQYELVAQHGTKGTAEQVLLNAGVTKAMLKTLQQKELVQTFFCTPEKQTPRLAQEPLALNEYQQQAFDSVTQNMGDDASSYKGFLLHGVTGSGKTEVYLQLIYHALKQGKQALVLVPEIGLTPQTIQRFKARFNANIVSLHSGMNATERLEAWSQINSGYADILIGTRSAVLAPFKDLGIIIVDEEHDSSYKQQSTLRYHAKNVALYRGVQAQCPVVLGSATPDFISLYNAKHGKLTTLSLPNRAGNAVSAPIKTIDLRGKYTQSSLTDIALDSIAYTLKKGEQVLIFLNRRGYAPSLICDACGWVMHCPHCDARMTLHHSPYTFLKCHHCEWQSRMPKTCLDCNSQNIKPVGTGTAKLEELLAEKFADYPLFRIDADTTRKKDSWAKLNKHIHANEPAILLGTQMLAKGHHFPNVTLVVMPNIDSGMISSDFRAPEKTAQLMLQVAGRAGREQKKGLVLIQSLQPENEQLLQLIREGYTSFAHSTMEQRHSMGLPPYRFCALVRVESKRNDINEQFLGEAKQLLLGLHNSLNNSNHNDEQSSEHKAQVLSVWGPLPAPMHKKANMYHTQLFILSNNRKQLHALLHAWWPQVLALPSRQYAKATLDIDPTEF